jgi:predicted ATPase with chaperone activity
LSRQAAAQQLRAATSAVIEAYRAGLQRLGSPLATREDAWQQCRYQARSIVAECAEALETGRAAEVAGAGGHHLTFSDPPGVGKTMVAERVPGLLPDLSLAEALEVSAVHSLAGLAAQRALHE